MQITRPRAVLLAVSILLLGTFILTRRGAGASASAKDDELAAVRAAVASVDAYVASCKAAKERYGYSLDGDVSVVRPWLAIGGRPDATLLAWRDGDKRRITHIVNALERDEEPAVAEAYGDNVLKLNLKDDGDDRRFTALLPEVVAFVRRARAADPDAMVYVHCKSGVNRAPSLAMALLISLDRATFVEALAAVRAARPSCRPKYVQAVAVYEDRERGRSTAPALRDGVDSAGFCDLYYGLKEDYSGGERWRSEHAK